MKLNKHIYENHLGGVYLTDGYDDTYEDQCPQCGDYDTYLGFCETAEDLANLLLSNNFDRDYVDEVLYGE